MLTPWNCTTLRRKTTHSHQFQQRLISSFVSGVGRLLAIDSTPGGSYRYPRAMTIRRYSKYPINGHLTGKISYIYRYKWWIVHCHSFLIDRGQCGYYWDQIGLFCFVMLIKLQNQHKWHQHDTMGMYDQKNMGRYALWWYNIDITGI